LTSDSERKERGNGPFEQLEDFIQQIDGRYIEIKPNPALPAQMKLAQTLSAMINEYNDWKSEDDHYNARITQEINQLWHLPPAGTEERMRALEKRMELAIELEPLIRDAKIQGMVHDGTRATEKLKDCQQALSKCREDNRKLSQQVLEYKNKLGLKN
jgi:hypothetical protein